MPKGKKDAWKISGLSGRVQQLIREGYLLRKNGAEEIYEVVRKEFAEQFTANSYKFDMRTFDRKLRDLLWNHKVLEDLKRAIRTNVPIERFRKNFYPYIPEKLLKVKVGLLTGKTSSHATTKFIAGMGRLSTEDLPAGAEGFEFPKITPQEPFALPGGNNAQVTVINGALIGLKYDRNIADNPVRRKLADARLRGATAVILTNTVEMDTKKTAGPNKVYRARVSGLRLNPDRFPKPYRSEVIRILKDRPIDELIFQTISEKFGEVMDGWHKITHRPDGSPEFPGPVFVVLGFLEEEIIAAAAYHECRALTMLKQQKIGAELAMARGRLTQALKDGSGIRKWTEEVQRLTQQKARTIITNIGEPEYSFHRRRMRALVVSTFEKVIPNCKVLGQGSVYLKLNDKSVKIHIPGHNSVTDGLLADFGDRYGNEIFEDTLADLTVICHPYALNHRLIGREDSKDGQPVTKFVHVAPICVDDVFLREALKDTTKKSIHPISKAIFDPQFKPGVIVLSFANGILSADPLPISNLGKVWPSAKTNFGFPNPGAKYITFYVNTDNHFGGSAKRYIWDPKSRMHFGTNEAAVELMRRSGIVNTADIGIHGVAELDDATDGNLWFNPTYRPDPQQMTIIRIEGWLKQMTADIQRASERGDNTAVQKLTEEVNKVSIAQLYFRGEHFPFSQMMQVYDRHIDPNLDFYGSVLGRFEKSKLVIRGISEINKSMTDTRDVGVLNFPNGNHRIHTLDGADLEGEYFARQLRAKLGGLPHWRDRADFLEKAIVAPRFGSETFGYGTIKSPGGFEWGLRFLGSPPRLSSWSDLLAALVKNDLARGDDSYGLLKHKTVTLMGDKHFYAKVDTNHIVYVICAAGVHTDLYGSTGGFPPNNTGVCFVSIPADGPDSGPVIMRMLPHDFLRDWFANPKPFSWSKFLPKAV